MATQVSGAERKFNDLLTHRFQIRNTFPCLSARLRAQKALLLEDETRAYQTSTSNRQDNTNDLEAIYY